MLSAAACPRSRLLLPMPGGSHLLYAAENASREKRATECRMAVSDVSGRAGICRQAVGDACGRGGGALPGEALPFFLIAGA